MQLPPQTLTQYLAQNKQVQLIWPNNELPCKQVTLGTFFHWIAVVSICHLDLHWEKLVETRKTLRLVISVGYWFLWVYTQGNTVLSVQNHREGELPDQIFWRGRLASSLRKLKCQCSCCKLWPNFRVNIWYIQSLKLPFFAHPKAAMSGSVRHTMQAWLIF